MVMPTIKQKKAVAKMVENGGNITKAMRDSGYSENTINTPQKLTESKGFKEARKPIIEQLEAARQQAMDRMKQTVSKASYADTTRTARSFTETIELLGGRPTNITKDLTQEQIDKGIRDGLAYLRKSGALPEHSGQNTDGEEKSSKILKEAP